MRQRNDLLSKFNSLKQVHGVADGTEFDLFGVRFPWGKDKDLFKDQLGIRTASGLYLWPGTTDPGIHAVQTQRGGAAHLCLGYHKDIWLVQTISPATAWAHVGLVQSGSWGAPVGITKPVKIWRDENRDNDYDDGENIQDGFFGIDYHRAARNTVSHIGLYGAGCQVTQQFEDFEFVMNYILNSKAYKANSKTTISYLLLATSEFL